MDSIKRIDERTIDISLVTFIYKEDDQFICLSPGLQIAGYGDNEDEAINSFKITIEDFVHDSLKFERLENVLFSLGWKYDQNESCGELDGKHYERIKSTYSGIPESGSMYAFHQQFAAVA